MRITFCKIEKQHHQDSTQHTPDHAAPNVAIINREYLIGVTPPRCVNISTQQSLHTYRARIDSPRFTSAASCMHAVWPRAARTWIAYVRLTQENPSGESTPSHLQEYYIRRSPSGRTIFASHSPLNKKNVCNSVANAGNFFVALATVLQTPNFFSWHLQQCCKRRKFFRGTCNSVANAKFFFVALATVLQTLEIFSWHLQRCCKRQNFFRGICNGVANIFIPERQRNLRISCSQ